jgi:hypothetical protein
MLAHFANNGFQIAMLYLYSSDLTEFNIDDTNTVPWPVFFSSALISLVLILYYRHHFSKNPLKTAEWQTVFSTDRLHRAEIVKSALNDHHMNPVLINKQDSSYHNFGQIEIHVTQKYAQRALRIIENDIDFE